MRKLSTIVTLVAAFGCVTASAQRTIADLSAILTSTPLFLRGCWSEDDLQFDSTGKPKSSYTAGPFTVSAFAVQDIKLDGHHLTISGQRVGIEFGDDKSMHRVPLLLPVKKKSVPETVTIMIDRDDNTDFGPALDAVFTNNIADLAPTLPDYWQTYFQQQILHVPGTPKPSTSDSDKTKVLNVGGTVNPPHILKSVDPSFTYAARSINYSGHVLVYLVVNEDGTPSRLRILRPMGLGLDEKAIEAVQQYRFQPAMRGSVPVKVELSIDVNFQIF